MYYIIDVDSGLYMDFVFGKRDVKYATFSNLSCALFYDFDEADKMQQDFLCNHAPTCLWLDIRWRPNRQNGEIK